MDSSLVELDGQHQEEINAVLAVKEELSASNKALTILLHEANKTNEVLRMEVQNLREHMENYSQVRDNEANDERRDSVNFEKELGEMKLRVKELESMVLEKDPPMGATNTAEFISGNTDANTMIQQISSENENLQNEADDLRTKLRGNAREMDQLKSEIESLKMENSNLREQLDQRNAVVEGLEDSLEKSEKTHAKKIAEYEEEVLALKEKLEMLSKVEETRVKTIPIDSNTQTGDEYINTSFQDMNITCESSQTDLVCVSSVENSEEIEQIINQQESLINDLRVRIEELETDQSDESLDMTRTNEKKVLEMQYVIQSLESQIKELTKNDSAILKEVLQKDNMIKEFDKRQVEFERYREEMSQDLQKWMDKANENEKLVEELQANRDSLRSKIFALEEISEVVEEKQERDESEKGVHDLRNVLKQKDAEIAFLNSKIEVQQLPTTSNNMNLVTDAQKNENMEMIKSLEGEKERLLTVLNEKSRECSSLKAEVHRLFGVVSAEKQAFSKLQQVRYFILNLEAISFI